MGHCLLLPALGDLLHDGSLSSTSRASQPEYRVSKTALWIVRPSLDMAYDFLTGPRMTFDFVSTASGV